MMTAETVRELLASWFPKKSVLAQREAWSFADQAGFFPRRNRDIYSVAIIPPSEGSHPLRFEGGSWEEVIAKVQVANLRGQI